MSPLCDFCDTPGCRCAVDDADHGILGRGCTCPGIEQEPAEGDDQWSGYDENGVWITAATDEHGNIVPARVMDHRTQSGFADPRERG